MKTSILSAITSVSIIILSLSVAQPVHAMQNIKCVKNGAAEKLAAWRDQAGELSKNINADGTQIKELYPALQKLVKEGDSVATACKACGAKREDEKVRQLTSDLKEGVEAFAVDGQISEKLLSSLEKIAAFEG